MVVDDNKLLEHELRLAFGRSQIGLTLAEEAMHRFRSSHWDYDIYQKLAQAGNFAQRLYSENADRHGANLDEWFSLTPDDLDDLMQRAADERATWMHFMQEEENDDAEEEMERLDRLEDTGAYGRTLPWKSDMDDWLFIRFGPIPANGKSLFGLARDDNEDGPDAWRQELGNMSHEAGMSVFRAWRHADHLNEFILIEPNFQLARYGVPDFETYLLSLLPDEFGADRMSVSLVQGSLTTIKAFDGTLRCDLGSDGEYLLNCARPLRSLSLQISDIWIAPSVSLEKMLEKSRPELLHSVRDVVLQI